jgi:cellobiose phosphorylase
MRYGDFDDANREFVITRPDTPFPWINYMGTGEFRSLVSNTAGGYCFYQDALLRRITRFRYNSIPVDMNGRYYYVKDGDSVWNPGWKPTMTALDSYECRHGLGYTKFTSSKGGVEAELTMFVPLGATAEVHALKLSNKGKSAKKLKLFSFVEFCLWNALDDMTNFQRNLSTGEVTVADGGALLVHRTEYRERRAHYAYFAVNRKPAGYDTDRDSFLGDRHRSLGNPEAVIKGKSANSVADGWHPVASHGFDIELPAGGSEEFVFILGYAENPKDKKWEKDGSMNLSIARGAMDAFGSPAKAAAALEALKAEWSALLNRCQFDTGVPEFDRMVNIWNQYQCMTTFRVSRSASYFESGIGRGVGFRDTNQDILGAVHLLPSEARQRILDVAATQHEDGGAYHQYQPLTKRGNNAIGGDFYDDPLWLILATTAYIKETGDWSILKEKVPFENDEKLAKSLLEHLKVSFRFVAGKNGPHGLPLIGRADWNDCLNLNAFSTSPEDSFQTCANVISDKPESVFIAGLAVFVAPDYAELLRRSGEAAEAAYVEKEAERLRKAVEGPGWDGEWYVRAYDKFERKIGSKECEDGKIFIESQGICGMAGIGADKGYPQKALESVKKHLDSKYGIVLNWPAYKDYHVELGEVSSYPPGYKENGGVFCHNNPWVVIAEALHGEPDRAFQYMKKITPAFRLDEQDIHTVEPYVYCQMIAGKQAGRHGQGKNSWLTGAASWTYVSMSQYILGLRPEFDGLRVEPALPAEIKGYKATRAFRGATYEIEVEKKAAGRGKVSIAVDGKPIQGSVVPAFADKGQHKVKVVIA